MSPGLDPQIRASDPEACVFVSANAGSGKTSTLVKRVARLLLAGARPEAILCVTYTRAGAAEMQRRLFDTLGDWAVAEDERLALELSALNEDVRALPRARALFARALETPGGLKIQTLHAFCEMVLRRFPLEADLSPGFQVLDDVAARQVAMEARRDLAELAGTQADGPVAAAYAALSVSLDFARFEQLFDLIQTRRAEIKAYCDQAEYRGGYLFDVWRTLGFEVVESVADIEAHCAAGLDEAAVRRAVAGLNTGKISDQGTAARLLEMLRAGDWSSLAAFALTSTGSVRKSMATKGVPPAVVEWLEAERDRIAHAADRRRRAQMAEDTVHVLTLAVAYGALYEAAKAARGALDFADVIERAKRLLAAEADAAWVLYKLDGGVEHVLLDEAQDTSPDQWAVLRALTDEFFAGEGVTRLRRTVFAVGDEKQSIFSFQGARPDRLRTERDHFHRQAQTASILFRDVPLTRSYRSAPEVLSLVDAVFFDPVLRRGLLQLDADNVDSIPPHHEAVRDLGGCVEIWPPEPAGEAEAPDPWDPVDAEPAASANKRLAARIARSMAAMIARGEAVLDRHSRQLRPCTAGDMLVLVRRRGALFDEILRALKQQSLPVAGADRLALSSHGVFQDLLALIRFARFPWDDLTLAGLLRSPFCDIDEEGLFDLASGRTGSLWSALRRRADECAPWREAADLLGWFVETANAIRPFDLLNRFLSRLDASGVTQRRRLLTRMGAEGREALDAFLAEILKAEARGVFDLETLAADLAAGETEIKREADESGGPDGGLVRVMTVHGAKGLEAPIVFLPDTTTPATPQGLPLMEHPDGGRLLWLTGGKEGEPDAASACRDLAARRVTDESARLLYVALTRARDRLIICGVEKPKGKGREGSWYHFCEQAFSGADDHPFALEGGGTGRRWGSDPAVLGRVAVAPDLPAAAPPWMERMAPAEPPAIRTVAPSALGEDDTAPAASPLARVGGLGRFRRGDLIHRLLERLPDLSPAAREAGARQLLSREMDLNEDQRAEMIAAALGVLTDPVFAPVFGPDSRAEVAIAGGAAALPPGARISGRIDRLVVEVDRVLVVDFKTNRPAPRRIEDVDAAYIRQMAVYAAVLGEIYPGRRIEAALLWTDGPQLMPVPEDRRLAALADLAAKAVA